MLRFEIGRRCAQASRRRSYSEPLMPYLGEWHWANQLGIGCLGFDCQQLINPKIPKTREKNKIHEHQECQVRKRTMVPMVVLSGFAPVWSNHDKIMGISLGYLAFTKWQLWC